MTPATEAENVLLVALHRAQFEGIASILGETYRPLEGKELKTWGESQLPFIRAHVAYELSLAHQREAVLRSLVVEHHS